MGINSGNDINDNSIYTEKGGEYPFIIPFTEENKKGELSTRMIDTDSMILNDPVRNGSGLKNLKKEFDFQIPDNVKGPFSDYKIDKLGNSVDWQTYYEVNGMRISEEDYFARQEAKTARLYGITLDQYRKSLQLSHENTLSVKNATAWLQSSIGGSKRAVLSPERAKFVAKNVPFEVLLALSDEQIEALGDTLTSFDVLRPDAVSQLQERLKLLWPDSPYFQNDNIDPTQAGVYTSILHNKKLDTEIPYEVSTSQEDMYVLAKIRASMLQGDTKAETVFSYFLTWLQERANKGKIAAKKREEAYTHKLFLPESIIQILNPNNKKQHIYDIHNEILKLYESPETLYALGMITRYRKEFQAIQREAIKKAQIREVVKAENQDTLGGTIGAPDETITKKTKSKRARKKKQGETPVGESLEASSLKGNTGAQETSSVEIGDSSRGSQMIRYLNGKQQFSLDGGITWIFADRKVQASLGATRDIISGDVAQIVDIRRKPSEVDPVVLTNSNIDLPVVEGNFISDNVAPVTLQEPDTRPGE